MKYTSRIGMLTILLASSAIAAPTDLPTGGSVVAGSATIGTAGSVMTVTSSSTRSVLTWNTFSIGTSAQVNFVQPNSGSAVLNRVTGNDVSQLFGTLSSNGSVFLVNPNGVVMSSSTQFNLPSITINTSTNTPSNADFLSGSINGFNTPTSAGGDISGDFHASGDITLAIGGNGNFGSFMAGGMVTISASGPVSISGGISASGSVSISSGISAGGQICTPSCQIGSFDPVIGSGSISVSAGVPASVGTGGTLTLPTPIQPPPQFVQPSTSITPVPGSSAILPNISTNGNIVLISPGGNINPNSGVNTLSLSGQSLQSGNGGGNLTISSRTAQNLIEKGQFKTSGGEVQITPQGAVEIMNTLVNSGSITNATTMTTNGNAVIIGL